LQLVDWLFVYFCYFFPLVVLSEFSYSGLSAIRRKEEEISRTSFKKTDSFATKASMSTHAVFKKRRRRKKGIIAWHS